MRPRRAHDDAAGLHEGSSAVWHLADVLSWLRARGAYELDQALLDVALTTMQVNLAKQGQRLREYREQADGERPGDRCAATAGSHTICARSKSISMLSQSDDIAARRPAFVGDIKSMRVSLTGARRFRSC